MIVAMNLMSKLIHRFFPEPAAVPTNSNQNAGNKSAKVAAITAAVQFHKNKKA